MEPLEKSKTEKIIELEEITAYVSEELRRSELKYRTLVEASLQGLVIAQGMPPRVVFANRAIGTILGLSSEELQEMGGDALTQFVHPEDRKKVFTRWSVRLAGSNLEDSYEFRVLSRTGEVRWLESRTVQVEFGGQPAIQAAFMDVTDRRKAEMALRESELKYRRLVESLPHAIVIIQHSKVIFYNRAATKILGVERGEDLYKREFISFVIPEERDRIADLTRRRIAGEQHLPEHYELRLHRQSGNTFPAEVFVKRIEFGGEPAVQMAILDITERKAQEEALRESEHRFRSLVENTRDIPFSTDPEGRLTYIAPQVAAYGFDPEVMLTQGIQNFVFQKDLGKVVSALERAVGQGIIRGVTFRVDTPTQGIRHFEETGELLRDGEGRTTGIVGILRDVTDRVEAEEALRRSHEELKESQSRLLQAGKMAAVGQLAAGIAHEINNPLAVIASSSEILTDLAVSGGGSGTGESASAYKHLKRIEDSVFRCKEIIENLLDFSRRDVEALGDVDLHQLIRNTLVFLEGGARVKERNMLHLTCPVAEVDSEAFGKDDGTRWTPDTPPLWFRTRRRQLQQALLNLLINSVDATEPGGRILVSATRGESGVTLAVGDSGRGIPESIHDRIFDPFFTTKAVGKGTGLGLYLSHQIVKALNGRIIVDSREGRGTVMRLWLSDPLNKGEDGPGGRGNMP